MAAVGLRSLSASSCGAAKARFNISRICLACSGEFISSTETVRITASAAISPARFSIFSSHPVYPGLDKSLETTPLVFLKELNSLCEQSWANAVKLTRINVIGKRYLFMVSAPLMPGIWTLQGGVYNDSKVRSEEH